MTRASRKWVNARASVDAPSPAARPGSLADGALAAGARPEWPRGRAAACATASAAEATHAVLIPSFNTGARLFDTIASVRRHGLPVIVVIDGSTDGTAEALVRVAAIDPGLLTAILPRNQGKGAAVLHGLRLARQRGFSYALTMDADGQHSAAHIGEMIATSIAHPRCMVLGTPIFDSSAPRVRVAGHKIANAATNLVAARGAIGDSLFGIRVYPIDPLIALFESTGRMRRFDFDSEAAIRLCWRGVTPINVATPVRYFQDDEGGVSHFRYLRDNLLLTAMYLRLAWERLTAGFKSSHR